jgi:hypothetical protein
LIILGFIEADGHFPALHFPGVEEGVIEAGLKLLVVLYCIELVVLLANQQAAVLLWGHSLDISNWTVYNINADLFGSIRFLEY